MKDKIEALIHEFDLKYRRVKKSDVAILTDLKSGEQIEMIKHQVRKRPVGQYELVSVYYPERESVFDTTDISDAEFDALYDEFDRTTTEIVGSDCTWVGPPTDKYSLGLLFTDKPIA